MVLVAQQKQDRYNRQLSTELVIRLSRGFVSGLTNDAVTKTLRILGPSDQNRMLDKMAEERRQADALIARTTKGS